MAKAPTPTDSQRTARVRLPSRSTCNELRTTGQPPKIATVLKWKQKELTAKPLWSTRSSMPTLPEARSTWASAEGLLKEAISRGRAT